MKLAKVLLFTSAALTLAGLVYMASGLLHRPYFLDEFVYYGDWFYRYRESGRYFPLTVQSKQPLFFWVAQIARQLSGAFKNQPLFMIAMPRFLSLMWMLLTPLVLSRALRGRGGAKLSLAICVVCFLLSPFVLIHAQLAMVEPIMIFMFAVLFWRLTAYLRQNTPTNLVALIVANALLALTKTGALIPMLGFGFACFVASFLPTLIAFRPALRLATLVQALATVGGYLFIVLNPVIHEESTRFFDPASLTFEGLARYLDLLAHLSGYFLTFLGTLALLAGVFLWRRRQKLSDPLLAWQVMALLATALLGTILAGLGLKQDIARYHVFTFIPLLLAGAAMLNALVGDESSRKSAWALVTGGILVLALGWDLWSAYPYFRDFGVSSPRLAASDRRQYFDIYSIESFAGVQDELLKENAEIYAFHPPYMEAMILRVLLGYTEARSRVKILPEKVEDINALRCDAKFGSTYILTGNWFFPETMHSQFTGLAKVRDFKAGNPAGIRMSLYRKQCGSH